MTTSCDIDNSRRSQISLRLLNLTFLIYLSVTSFGVTVRILSRHVDIMTSKLNWFITGVSSGLGFALAKYVLAQGHNVVGTVRRRERAVENIRTLEAAGGKCFTLDVTQTAAIPQAIEVVRETLGNIDVLVNNAARALIGSIEDTS